MADAHDTDVIGLLKGQHQQVKALLDEVQTAEGERRGEMFTQLRRLLAVHESAEEQIVHPRVRRAVHDGDAIAVARLGEERSAKEALAELEKMDVDSAEFAGRFAAFAQDVRAHAEAEEREEFPQLSAALDDADLERMRRAVELAEKVAPTRPHPGVELAGEHLMAGPFAAMLDRARDLITGKR